MQEFIFKKTKGDSSLLEGELRSIEAIKLWRQRKNAPKMEALHKKNFNRAQEQMEPRLDIIGHLDVFHLHGLLGSAQSEYFQFSCCYLVGQNSNGKKMHVNQTTSTLL